MPITKSAYQRYEIIDELLSKQRVTRQELKEKLERRLNLPLSLSTLDKDIKFLKQHFKAPITQNQKRYEYSDKSFSISNIKLSHSEKRALEFSLDVLENSMNSEIIQEAKTILDKLARKVSADKEASKIISRDTSFDVGGVEWIGDLYDAIKDKMAILIEYNSPRQKKIVKHNFSPYVLKEYQGMWYVIGFSDQKEFTIVLALDRIKDIRKSNVDFHIDPNFSPTKYFKHSLGITHRQYSKPEKVKFWVDKDAYYYMKVRPLHGTQKVLEETEDGFIVQLEVFLSEELLITLMGLGGRVKVLEPAELVKDIMNHLDKMNKYYK
jgi:predicted DNA-binding transcriptional regulator YafY